MAGMLLIAGQQLYDLLERQQRPSCTICHKSITMCRFIHLPFLIL